MEQANWTWGLALIALTVAIHATGVVMMAFVMVRIRVRLENRNRGLRNLIPIVVGAVSAAGLLLAALQDRSHDLGSHVFVVGRRRFAFGCAALFPRPDDNAWCLGAGAATALAHNGSA